ncbi:hypothetical protein J7K43_03675 [Candidatus Calescamantes bacterium]|nr:hypothetical protein [Candidatus Calescamantes bacterium]
MNTKNLISRTAYVVFLLSFLGIVSIVFQGVNKVKSFKSDEKGERLFWEGESEKVKALWKEEWEKKKEMKIARKLSILYLKEGWIEEGIRFHKEALDIYPEDPKLRFNLSLIYFQDKRLDNAWKELEKIKEKHPFFPNLHYLRGLILEKKGRKKEAYKEFLQELNTYPECVGALEKIKLLSNKDIEK